MANQFGIDLGNALARAEEIRAARITNQFRAKSLELEQTGAEQRNALGAIQLQQAQQGVADDNALRAARAQALEGVTDPTKPIALISPAEATKTLDYMTTLDKAGREKAAARIDQMGRLANYVLTSDDPQAAYAEVLDLLPEDQRQAAPPQYDEKFVKLQLARATALSEIAGQTEDLIKNAPSGYRYTDSSRTTLVPIKGGPKDPNTIGETGLKTDKSNAVRATVLSQFGGTYDPQTGAFSLMDPEQAPRMLQVMDAAEAALKADPSLGIAQAVRKAMQSAGPAADGDGADSEGAGDVETIKVDADGNVIE